MLKFFSKDTFRQEEILENRIFEDDDNSNEDKLDAEVNELVRSKNEFENSNEDSDSKQVEKFISSAEDINSTHTKNLDSDVEKVESQGTHSFNMKNALMILGASLVGVFAIAIFVAIYRHKKNQHKDQFIQGKMKSDHSFHIQPVFFDGDDEHYDMVWIVVEQKWMLLNLGVIKKLNIFKKVKFSVWSFNLIQGSVLVGKHHSHLKFLA